MSDKPDDLVEAVPEAPAALGEPGEHPLSVLLFSWMRSKLFFLFLMVGLGVSGLALIGVEIWLRHEPVRNVASAPGFYGAFGFVAFAFAVLSGWPLGKLLRRPEDYYDRRSGEAGRDR